MSDVAAFIARRISSLFPRRSRSFLAVSFCDCLHFQVKFNLVLQVLKEKKPLTDWSNITGSAPCMMSFSPLSVHKPPQVCSVLPWIHGMRFQLTSYFHDRCIIYFYFYQRSYQFFNLENVKKEKAFNISQRPL